MEAGPIRVALTGGIATGKSYCLARFAAAGAPTISADEVARDVVRPGSPALEAIRARFGPAAVGPDGQLDRAAVAAVVFQDEEARRALERIVHPAVYSAIERWYSSLAQSGHLGPAIADIPLLFETGRDADFEVVVATVCAPEVQVARLRERGLAPEEVERRLASQWSAEEKARRAAYVIDTNGSFADTDRQVAAIWARLTSATLPPR